MTSFCNDLYLHRNITKHLIMIDRNKTCHDNEGLKYLNTEISQLEAEGGKYTAKEIAQQPQLWLDTYKLVVTQQSEIKEFLNIVFKQKDLQVILTGAGTSAFIGDILQGSFQKATGLTTKAIATTDLVSHPELYLQKNKPTLLISFARSGNSPESLAAINLANAICKNIYHLKITCNPDGDMVKNKSNNTLVFLLPTKADDQSLAMTGSFTSMLLTGFLIAHINKINELKNQIEKLSEYGQNILDNYNLEIRNIAALNFKRAVFLGSGPLLGSARESHLKLQELTDGKVICKHDSFLGFRHGPKAVIDSSTLIVYLFSNDKYVNQYETDLVKDINKGENGLFTIGILESDMYYDDPNLKASFDLIISLTHKKDLINEALLAVCYVLVAQILGFHKSINLGLKPDTPSKSNTITRVVQGVHIYPYNGEINEANGK